jgi:hypothetical protein
MPQQQEFEDPKIILTASLLRQRDEIANLINGNSSASALRAMATLMAQLSIEPEEKALIEAKKELIEHTVFLSADRVMYFFQLINDFLNKTYFADFHKAKPKVKDAGHI